MSYQAMEAVQDHSRYTEDTPENFAPFKIMMAIARYADRTGVAGVAGQYRKCPSFRAIAKKANVHRNTVSNWIPKLVETGEITIETGGSGRASWTVYYIQLPIESDARAAEPATMAQGTAQGTAQGMAQAIETMAQEIAQVRALMAQGIAQGGALMAQGNGTNGTSPLSKSGQIQDTEIHDETLKQTDPTRDAGDFDESAVDFDGEPEPEAQPMAEWGDVLADLELQMLSDVFNTKLKGSSALIAGDSLTVVTGNQYQADWVNGRLRDVIRQAAAAHVGHAVQVTARPAFLSELSTGKQRENWR